MILAQVNTGSYEFMTLADTKDAADAQLLDAYDRHVDQFPPTWALDTQLMRERIADGDVQYNEIQAGDTLRDGSKI